MYPAEIVKGQKFYPVGVGCWILGRRVSGSQLFYALYEFVSSTNSPSSTSPMITEINCTWQNEKLPSSLSCSSPLVYSLLFERDILGTHHELPTGLHHAYMKEDKTGFIRSSINYWQACPSDHDRLLQFKTPTIYSLVDINFSCIDVCCS